MNRPEKLPSAASPHIASRMEGIEPFHVVVLINRAKELEAQGQIDCQHGGRRTRRADARL